MANVFLELRNISKRFGNVEALRSVDLDVRADELLVVLGPTGAGKTTLLRTIAGLESPDAGSLAMDGIDITHMPPPGRDVALVFQNFSLYPEWTVRKNLQFPLRAPGRDLSPSEIDQRVEWAAQLLGVTHLLDRKATQLSGGEMQRIAIGRAIVRRPRIFLMDEPLSNLDAKLRETLRTELVQLRRRLATPMIFVTHDQVEALSMADRVVVLSEGQILQTGTPEEIYRDPSSVTVATQLGQPAINIFEVTSSGGMWLAADGTPLLPVESGAEAGGPKLLAVRPEDLETTGGEHPATVIVVEDTGPTKILLVEWAGQNVHIIAPRDTALRQGDALHPRIARGLLLQH